MKQRFLAMILILYISFSVHAQDSDQKNRGSIGISYNFGVIQDSRSNNDRYAGSIGNEYYTEKVFYTIGLST